MTSPRFTYKDKPILIKADRYNENDRIALIAMCRPADWNDDIDMELVDENGDIPDPESDDAFSDEFAVLTINISDASEPPPKCAYFKNWSENQDLFQALVDQKIISPPIVYVPSGFVRVPLCRILVPLE